MSSTTVPQLNLLRQGLSLNLPSFTFTVLRLQTGTPTSDLCVEVGVQTQTLSLAQASLLLTSLSPTPLIPFLTWRILQAGWNLELQAKSPSSDARLASVHVDHELSSVQEAIADRIHSTANMHARTLICTHISWEGEGSSFFPLNH